MQGIFINGRRPTSKKQIKEQIAADPNKVALEATSMFGGEYTGPVTGMPQGRSVFRRSRPAHEAQLLRLDHPQG